MPYQSIYSGRANTLPSGKTNPFAGNYKPGQYLVKPQSQTPQQTQPNQTKPQGSSQAQLDQLDAAVKRNTGGSLLHNIKVAGGKAVTQSAATAARGIAQQPARAVAEVGVTGESLLGNKSPKITPNKVGQFLMGKQTVKPLQQQGEETAAAHPGGFHIKGTPITLTPAETGVALAGGKGILDLAQTVGMAKSPIKTVDKINSTSNAAKTTVKNATVNTLLNKIKTSSVDETPKSEPIKPSPVQNTNEVPKTGSDLSYKDTSAGQGRGTAKVMANSEPKILSEKGSAVNKSNVPEVYRGGGEGSMPKGMTAHDVINYEKNTLGNADVKPVAGVDLKSIPSERLQWVTETPQAAKEYGKVTPVNLNGYKVVAKDGQGGLLIDKSPVTQPAQEIKPPSGIAEHQALTEHAMKFKTAKGFMDNAKTQKLVANSALPETLTPAKLQEIHAQALEPRNVPLEPLADTTPKIKTSKLATGVEQKAIEKKLTTGFEGKPEYAQVNMADQAKAATDLLNSDPERAIRIAHGKELPPEGLLPESVFVATENHALKSGNADLLRSLATESSLPSEATGMGQRIRTLAERDPNSAVGAINKVLKARAKVAEGRLGKPIKQAINDTTKAIKAATPKVTRQNWGEFVESLRC